MRRGKPELPKMPAVEIAVRLGEAGGQITDAGKASKQAQASAAATLPSRFVHFN